MNPPRHRRPRARIAANERVHFVDRQLIALMANLVERFARTLDEAASQVLVREQPSDDELNGLLRHAGDRVAISAPPIDPRLTAENAKIARGHVRVDAQI